MKTIISLITRIPIVFFSVLFFTSPAIAQKGAKLSDPEIASVAVTANQIDIDAAKMAQNKSTNPAITNFAKTMISDHQSVIDKATALVQKLGVTPKDNALSRQLSSNAAKTHNELQAKSGNAFDKAYINNEVAYHKAVISTVENKLVPDATNTELKDLLQSVLPVLRTHLEHAQMVQKQIAGK